MAIERVRPEEARQLVLEGRAYLVCAYEDEGKFRENPLEGALSLAEFREMLPDMPPSKTLIFYCG